MLEEENKPTNEQAITPDPADLVKEAQALNEMSNRVNTLEQENSQLREAKKKYYDAVLNGQKLKEVVQERSPEEIRKDLFGKKDKDSMTNLEYAKLAIELDDAVIKETGESIFLPKGKGITPTVDERDTAKRLNSVLKDCINKCNNNPKVFNQLLESNIRY